MSAEIKKELQLEIAYVLFIDIIGYSKLSVNDQHAAVEKLNEVVRASEQFQGAEAAGRLVKIATGDGVALVFYTSPEAPAQCAVEISRALKEHPRLQLRMGVHSGPVSGVIDVNGQANLAGAGLNMAQRVMDCGDAGHILVSKRVADDLGEYRHWRPLLYDLGECEVKHGMRISIVNLHADQVGNPELPKKFQALRRHRAQMRWAVTTAALVALAAIVAGSAMFSRNRVRSTLAAPEKSIAVLPFENRSRDPDNAYFADGIQDEILTRLSKIADLKVISRTSTQHYKSAPENLPEIAKQLGVAHILEGSVQKSGDAVRVNVQLIRAANDSHLWADTFDRKLIDIFSVESEVAKAIADQLRAKLTGREEQAVAAKPTDNLEAYDAYLRGLAYTQKLLFAPGNDLAAQKYLKEAVRLDPKFALSWALLSYVDARGYLTATLQPTSALREEARQAAETALTLQPNLGEAVMAKGAYHYFCLADYDAAVRYFEEARPLLPNDSRIPESLAYVARRQGQWDRSEAYFNEAERLDPRDVNLLAQHAGSYESLRRFPEALRKLDQVLDITPDDLHILARKAAIAQAEGDLPQASALLAPLHPAADDSSALETQVYQAILERRPTQMIPRLKEILAKPDPALGYYNGELRFWLGWAQDVAGDHSGAQESWRQARSELESFLKEQPENYSLIGDIALTNMGLGDKAMALTMSERAMAVISIEKDAVNGPLPIEVLARVAARMGEPDRAIAALQKLLSIPYNGPLSGSPLTPALLQLDPMFDHSGMIRPLQLWRRRLCRCESSDRVKNTEWSLKLLTSRVLPLKKTLTGNQNPAFIGPMKIKPTLISLAVFFAAATVCSAANPFMGTWKLNEAKSKLAPGGEKNNTVVYKSLVLKVKVTIDGTDAKGKAFHNEWTGNFDGKDYPVTGDPESDMRSYTKVNDRTMNFTIKNHGKVTITGRIVVSADGKSRTVNTTGTMKGKKVKSTAVYDKA